MTHNIFHQFCRSIVTYLKRADLIKLVVYQCKLTRPRFGSAKLGESALICSKPFSERRKLNEAGVLTYGAHKKSKKQRKQPQSFQRKGKSTTASAMIIRSRPMIRAII